MSDTGVEMCPSSQPIWVKALLSSELSAVEYRLWSYLYWRQGDNGYAWPSQATIAMDLGLTGEGVRKITKRLEQAGWLIVTCPNGPGRGSKHCKKYEVTCPQKPPTAIPLFSTETPNSRTVKPPTAIPLFSTETPNARTVKPPTAVGVNTVHEHLHLERSTAGGERITFDRAVGRFVGIDGQLETWTQTYPDIDVAGEIRKAAAWAAANPSKGKRNWQRFLVNWMARAGKDLRNGSTRQHRTPRPSFAGQVSAFGEVVEV